MEHRGIVVGKNEGAPGWIRGRCGTQEELEQDESRDSGAGAQLIGEVLVSACRKGLLRLIYFDDSACSSQ